MSARQSRGVGLIAQDDAFGRHMAHRLSDRLRNEPDPLRVVLAIGRPGSHSARRRRRIPGLGALRRLLSADRRAMAKADALDREARAFFMDQVGPPPDWPTDCALRNCPPAAVNADDTAEWLRSHGLRLAAVVGAPILRPPVLSTTSDGFLNVHSSLLPRYRGTRAEFWQVHNDEVAEAGLTVHMIDPGIDTGDIILQRPLRATASEGPWIIRARNQLQALDALPDAVAAVLTGEAERRPQPRIDERTYRYADITPTAIRRVLLQMAR